MDLKRIARHLLTTPGRLRKALPRHGLAAIEKAIAASESRHAGQVRFAAEASLDVGPLFSGQPARDRAIEVFSQLRVWDTEHNNGVLIYLLFADRSIEIIADRGIHARIGQQELKGICRGMEAAFKKRDFVQGVVGGIEEVTRHLARHFPAAGARRNELPDRPTLL